MDLKPLAGAIILASVILAVAHVAATIATSPVNIGYFATVVLFGTWIARKGVNLLK
ncbi:MAG TPA: hypothetical protein VFI61_00615 [Patescibacteria group bacterium]|nr:hypothetical protein [Patescibacteria group bacterium]